MRCALYTWYWSTHFITRWTPVQNYVLYFPIHVQKYCIYLFSRIRFVLHKINLRLHIQLFVPNQNLTSFKAVSYQMRLYPLLIGDLVTWSAWTNEVWLDTRQFQCHFKSFITIYGVAVKGCKRVQINKMVPWKVLWYLTTIEI